MLESDFLRNREAQAGEMKLEAMPSRRDLKRGVRMSQVRQRASIDEHLLDHYRRSKLILFHIARIDRDQPLARREPQPSISRFAAGRLHTPGTLERRKALAFAVSE